MISISPYRSSVHKSFGLIEVIISGVILITVVGSTVVLKQRSSGLSTLARHRSTAYLLAEEGVEATRQIRDTNYMAKRYDPTSGNFIKTSWQCDLKTLVSLQSVNYGLGGSHAGLVCDPATTTAMSTNNGNFATGMGANNGTMELGNGLWFGSIFTDVGGNALKPLPTWSLSAPANGSRFDAGPNVMAADQNGNTGCDGVESIYVQEGANQDNSGTFILTNSTALNSLVRINRRPPVADSTTTNINKQDNFHSIISSSCTTSNPPSGYTAYRRQVSVVSSPMTLESAGNMPTDWSNPTTGDSPSNHVLRVLVRVSWTESSRALASGEEQAVMLGTYLTDWRKTN